tara:strand:+ start:7677 stop:7898 length:222 start_codon:yes stop_codon:yes gene_type:complete
MYLEKWCNLTNISKRELSKRLGNATPTTVTRWTKSKRFPTPQSLIKIEKLTEGVVTANDFVKQWEEAHGKQEG